MPLRDEMLPSPMMRAAIAAPDTRLRRVLVEIADLAVFEPDQSPDPASGPIDELVSRAVPAETDLTPQLALEPADPEELATARSVRTPARRGDHRTSHRSGDPHGAMHDGPGMDTGPRGRTGPRRDRPRTVVRSPQLPGPPRPRAADRPRRRRARHGVSATGDHVRHGPVSRPRSDVVRCGRLHGDVRHDVRRRRHTGSAIVAIGIVAGVRHGDRLRRARPAAPFLIGAGLAATVFGLLYGEAFGPTGLVPTLWIRPLDEPERLLRRRAGRRRRPARRHARSARRSTDGESRATALRIYDASGLAGTLLLFGLAGFVLGARPSIACAAVRRRRGGRRRRRPHVRRPGRQHRRRGRPGLAEAVRRDVRHPAAARIEHRVVHPTRRVRPDPCRHQRGRVGRHRRAVGPRHRCCRLSPPLPCSRSAISPPSRSAPSSAPIQALRLEYYEMFSRLFVSQGRPFDPWHVPAQRLETS